MDIKRILFGPPSDPECPISKEDVEWTENKILWIASVVGKEKLLSVRTILPNKEYFPDEYRETEDYGESVFERLMKYMSIDEKSVELAFYSDYVNPANYNIPLHSQTHLGPSGLYMSKDNRYLVAIEYNNLASPIKMIATMAHELGHVLLIGSGMISSEDIDHEPLTDILVIFLGLGVFIANAAFQFKQWNKIMQQGWSASKLGYLPEPMIGYILACYALFHGNSKPHWTKQINYNIRVYMNKSIKYINQTGDTQLKELFST